MTKKGKSDFLRGHQNWQPGEGKYSAQLAFIRGVEWPVVILTSEDLVVFPVEAQARIGCSKITPFFVLTIL